jgi:hypothetical protein
VKTGTRTRPLLVPEGGLLSPKVYVTIVTRTYIISLRHFHFHSVKNIVHLTNKCTRPCKKSCTRNHVQEIMHKKSCTRNHAQEIMHKKSCTSSGILIFFSQSDLRNWVSMAAPDSVRLEGSGFNIIAAIKISRLLFQDLLACVSRPGSNFACFQGERGSSWGFSDVCLSWRRMQNSVTFEFLPVGGSTRPVTRDQTRRGEGVPTAYFVVVERLLVNRVVFYLGPSTGSGPWWMKL